MKMTFMLQTRRRRLSSRLMLWFILSSFISNTIFFPSIAQAQIPIPVPTVLIGGVTLPQPGHMLAPSISYQPAVMAGLTLNTENPFEFNFIINNGDDKLTGADLETESKKLINYFLASLTVPEDQMWVNLSPYEKDRIIADGLSKTEMGRDMLALDYILKQFTASLMFPEGEQGKKFWERIYATAQNANVDIPTNTFNKVWIVPDQANVYVHEKNVFVVRSHLKVMLEEDYLAAEKAKGIADTGLGKAGENLEPMTPQAAQLIREIILPEIEREVNEGKTFANLRQIYNSMILAAWYKKNLKQSVLNKVYADQNKINGIDLADKNVKDKLYTQYLEAFKKGVYDYIKEDYDPKTQEVISKKYFSGGLKLKFDEAMLQDSATSEDLMSLTGAQYSSVRANIQPTDSIQRKLVLLNELEKALNTNFGPSVNQEPKDIVIWRHTGTRSLDQEFLELVKSLKPAGVEVDVTTVKGLAVEVVLRSIQSKTQTIESMLTEIAKEKENIVKRVKNADRVMEPENTRADEAMLTRNVSYRLLSSERIRQADQFLQEAKEVLKNTEATPANTAAINFVRHFNRVEDDKGRVRWQYTRKLKGVREERTTNLLDLGTPDTSAEAFYTDDTGIYRLNSTLFIIHLGVNILQVGKVNGGKITIQALSFRDAKDLFDSAMVAKNADKLWEKHTNIIFNLEFKAATVGSTILQIANRDGVAVKAMLDVLKSIDDALKAGTVSAGRFRRDDIREIVTASRAATPAETAANFVSIMEKYRDLEIAIKAKGLEKPFDFDHFRNRIFFNRKGAAQIARILQLLKEAVDNGKIKNDKNFEQAFTNVITQADSAMTANETTETLLASIDRLIQLQTAQNGAAGEDNQIGNIYRQWGASRRLSVDQLESLRTNLELLSVLLQENAEAPEIESVVRAIEDLEAGIGLDAGFFVNIVDLTLNPLQEKSISKDARVDAAITADSLNYRSLSNVPSTFDEILSGDDRLYLDVKDIQIVQLSGDPAAAEKLLSNPETEFAVSTSVAQSLGSIVFAGQGKGIKEVADGNAVYMTEENIKAYIARHPKKAIVVLADEGERDGSFSLRMARIYWSGYEQGFKDPYAKIDGTEAFDSNLYNEALDQLREQGVEISYYSGDALEHTNGLYREGADKEPSDSWALAALRDDDRTSQRRPYNDTFFRKAGISFNNLNGDAGIQPFDLPSVVVQKLAKSKNIVEGTQAFEDFVNSIDITVLGPRSEKDKKENEGHKHGRIIADAKELQKKYPGLKVLTPGDGDFTSRLFSALGVKFDGRERITFGRSGMAESTIAEQVADMVPGGYFVNRFVSKSGTENDLTEENADKYSEPENAKFRQLGFSAEDQRRVRSRCFKGSGITAAREVTGASKWLFGGSISQVMKGVNFNETNDTVEVSTVLTTLEGIFLLKTNFKATRPLMMVRSRIATASPAAVEYAMDHAMIATESSAVEQIVVGLIQNLLMEKSSTDEFYAEVDGEKISSGSLARMRTNPVFLVNYAKGVLASVLAKQPGTQNFQRQQITLNNNVIRIKTVNDVSTDGFRVSNSLDGIDSAVEQAIQIVASNFSEEDEKGRVYRRYRSIHRDMQVIFNGKSVIGEEGLVKDNSGVTIQDNTRISVSDERILNSVETGFGQKAKDHIAKKLKDKNARLYIFTDNGVVDIRTRDDQGESAAMFFSNQPLFVYVNKNQMTFQDRSGKNTDIIVSFNPTVSAGLYLNILFQKLKEDGRDFSTPEAFQDLPNIVSALNPTEVLDQWDAASLAFPISAADIKGYEEKINRDPLRFRVFGEVDELKSALKGFVEINGDLESLSVRVLNQDRRADVLKLLGHNSFQNPNLSNIPTDVKKLALAIYQKIVNSDAAMISDKLFNKSELQRLRSFFDRINEIGRQKAKETTQSDLRQAYESVNNEMIAYLEGLLKTKMNMQETAIGSLIQQRRELLDQGKPTKQSAVDKLKYLDDALYEQVRLLFFTDDLTPEQAARLIASYVNGLMEQGVLSLEEAKRRTATLNEMYKYLMEDPRDQERQDVFLQEAQRVGIELNGLATLQYVSLPRPPSFKPVEEDTGFRKAITGEADEADEAMTVEGLTFKDVSYGEAAEKINRVAVLMAAPDLLRDEQGDLVTGLADPVNTFISIRLEVARDEVLEYASLSIGHPDTVAAVYGNSSNFNPGQGFIEKIQGKLEDLGIDPKTAKFTIVGDADERTITVQLADRAMKGNTRREFLQKLAIAAGVTIGAGALSNLAIVTARNAQRLFDEREALLKDVRADIDQLKADYEYFLDVTRTDDSAVELLKAYKSTNSSREDVTKAYQDLRDRTTNYLAAAKLVGAYLAADRLGREDIKMKYDFFERLGAENAAEAVNILITHEMKNPQDLRAIIIDFMDETGNVAVAVKLAGAYLDSGSTDRQRVINAYNDFYAIEGANDEIAADLTRLSFTKGLSPVAVRFQFQELVKTMSPSVAVKFVGLYLRADAVEQKKLSLIHIELAGFTTSENAAGLVPYVFMPKATAVEAPGGIDFNADHLNLKEQGEEFNFDFSNTDFQNLQPNMINGLQPVIINITPLTTILPLLGYDTKTKIFESAKL